MERRWSMRLHVDLTMRLSHRNESIGECVVRDLSLDGACLVRVPKVYPVGTHLALSLPVKDGSHWFTLDAMVMHASHDEMGVMFYHKNADGLDLLREYAAGPSWG